MKKVLLGLFVLSAMAMAASNPGDDESTARPKGKAEAGVPMEVKVEILPEAEKLILVDENNKLIDKLVFDHGRIVKKGLTQDSKIEKTVKLTFAKQGTKFGTDLSIQFSAVQGGKRILETGEFVLNGLGSASEQTINSKLVYRENKIPGEDKTEIVTPVVSVIAASEINTKESGLYTGQGTFEAIVAKTTSNDKFRQN